MKEMTKNMTQDAATDTPEIDLSKLSVKELADMLAKARQAEKAKKAEESSLPQFAFVVVMEDSSLVYWSGKAVAFDAAKQDAVAYAERNGDKVFRYDDVASVTPRPIPSPRGRKAKATE
jgi:hypothetical protein